MFANDPGLGNKYIVLEGPDKGKVGYWAGAGDYGRYLCWEEGGQDCVPYCYEIRFIEQ